MVSLVSKVSCLPFTFAYWKSPVGMLRVCGNKDALKSIIFSNNKKESPTKDLNILEAYILQLKKYFAGDLERFSLPLFFEGTEFQKKVWRELLKIPYGETRSYKEIAKSVGSENGFRAVGSANNKNKIMIVIPCHRVIGTDSKLKGFGGGGIEVQKKLLEIEKKNLGN